MIELYVGIILWFIVYLLDHERDTSRSNFEKSLASKLLTEKFIDNNYFWFVGNLWTPELYYANRLFKISFLPDKWEWFLVKNAIVFLNDYWKFCKFFIMVIVCFVLAYFTGYWWLMFPYFIIGGGLHSAFDGSLLRKSK